MVEFSFLILVLAVYGTGAITFRALSVPSERIARDANVFLTLVAGTGIFGQLFFVGGCVVPIYTKFIVRGVAAILAIVGLLALIRDLRMGPRVKWGRTRLAESCLLLIVVGLMFHWFMILRGFLPGSDVFSHHYTHARVMIQAHRFVHDVMLPWGTDIHSNYNPTLVHLLYMAGRLLFDERVANLFHWLTQVLVVAGIYISIRALASRSAALLGITLYFGANILANFVPDVQDYSMGAVFLLASVSSLILALRLTSPRLMVLAGVFCGLAMSSKYYAFLFLPLIVLIVAFQSGVPMRNRVRDCARILIAAGIVVSPWLVYNLAHYGDPVYPVFRRLPEFSVFIVSYPMHMLHDFIAPADRGLAMPTIRYYCSLFVPYDQGDAQFGLGIMYLITLPAVAASIVRRPLEIESRIAIAAFALFLGLHLIFGRVAFYKWTLFPAVLYVIALSVMSRDWLPRWRQLLWVAAVAAAALNYSCLVYPRLRTYVPASRQSDLWNAQVRALNAQLPAGAVVAGVTAQTEYYLRDDVVAIRARDSMATSWDAEQRLLGEVHATYYVDYEGNGVHDQEFYRTVIDAWRQLAPDDPRNAEFLIGVAAQVRETQRRKQEFLGRVGSFAGDIGAGARLYRLDWSALERPGVR